MKITTEHCRQFLVKFHTDHPEFLYVYTELGDSYNFKKLDEDMRADANKPSNWKRAWKGKVSPDQYMYYPEDIQYTKHDIYDENLMKSISGDELAFVRIFELNPNKWEANVAFMVLETKDGKLLLGQYVGCDDEMDADWRSSKDD